MEENRHRQEKIALLNDSFPPTIDGVATTVFNYATYIQKNHADALVVTPYYPDVTDSYDFPVFRYPSIDLKNLMYDYRAGNSFSPRLLSRLRTEKPSLIHSHCPAMSNTLARLCMDNIDAPVVFTYHTKFDIDLAKTIHSHLVQEAAIKYIVSGITACDEVWVVSRGAGENLRGLGYKGDYLVMDNGVDFPRGRATDAAIDEISREWDLPQGVPVFLFVGRMLWYKGIRLDMDGLKRLHESGQDFRFLLVGDGIDRQEIEDYAEEIGIAEKCIFTGAIHDREKLRAYFSRADLFLFASTYDTNGIVVREAAACSCPSVLIRGSCAAEGVTDKRSGLLIEETAEGMAEALGWACANRALLSEIGVHAANEIYLSWEDAVARAYARYEVILNRHRTAPKERKPFVVSDEIFRAAGAVIRTCGDMQERFTDSRKYYLTLERAFQARLEQLENKTRAKNRAIRAEWKEQWNAFLKKNGHDKDFDEFNRR